MGLLHLWWYGFASWIQTLTYFLPLLLSCCMQYHVLDRITTGPGSCFNIKTVFPLNLHYKDGCKIDIPILVSRHLYIETTPHSILTFVHGLILWTIRACFNVKTVFIRFMYSHYKDKIATGPSYLYNGILVLVRQHPHIDTDPWSSTDMRLTVSLLAKIYILASMFVCRFVTCQNLQFWQVCSFVGLSVCLSVLSSITHERFDISSPNLVPIWNGSAVPVCNIDK